MREAGLPAKMRAAVITGPRMCKVRVVERPEPAADQLLVRLEGSGVSASNLPLWEGRPWHAYPVEPGKPGHEGWGRVVATGNAVSHIKVGDRVAFLSEHAFSEYDVTPATSAVVLPASLANAALPGEPLGCVMNIWRRAMVSPGDNVAIIGVGFLGALLAQLATRSGARVIAISQRAYSLELARQMGARETMDLGLSDSEIVARVGGLTGGGLCDCVIEVVGMQRPLDLGAKICRARGRLVIAGSHQEGPRNLDLFLWNWRGLDVINAHEREPATCVAGMAAAIDSISSGRLDPAGLYTHRVPLERAGEAFEALRTRPDGFVKALVTP